jgi:hypothetical protein
MKMISELTYSTRREIREELLRQEAEGVSLDPAVKCRCDRCGAIHYCKKEETNDGTPSAGNHQEGR